MDELAVILIIIVVGLLLTGPVALIISIIALNRTKQRSLHEKKVCPPLVEPVLKQQMKIPLKEEVITQPSIDKKKFEAKKEILLSQAAETLKRQEGNRILEKVSLEQRIGTRWILIAGVITVIFGVGFFLKYAYDNSIIGPLGRVVISAVSGLAALLIGEITRKRGFDVVAKAVTGLGFAILYAAVFSAYKFYGLIDSIPAFALAILITFAAMLYAVRLNEILVAVLSLLGGFLTPVLVSTGENMPTALFSYVLVLGIGAMLCAYYRKWRVVNLIAYTGTFILYTGWFEKFFRPAFRNDQTGQMAIALGWLGVFFGIYLVLPLFNGLVKKIRVQKEDVLLVLSNAAVTFYYLWTILYKDYRIELAYAAIGLCAAHLVLMSIVTRRCQKDINLRLGLLLIGLFFLTIAVPLYLKMYAVSLAWACESIVLVVIGLRYKSIWTQLSAAAAILLSLSQLIYNLPMHSDAFRLILNPAFGTWAFVSAAIMICHLIYRYNSKIGADLRTVITQVFYSASILVLASAVIMEWYRHCDYNIISNDTGESYFIKGMLVIFTLFMLLFAVRPICPAGNLCKVLAGATGFVGSIFLLCTFREIYHNSFTIFANINFLLAILFVAGVFASAWFLKRSVRENKNSIVFSNIFGLAGIAVLFVLLSEQIYLYWYCQNRFTGKIPNWEFLANMYISIMWAIYGLVLMTLGFWRKVAMLRYISLGLFGLLLAKVFILDMSTVKNVYRIAAFLATGVTLVFVSYFYQYLKNKGFFEVMLASKKTV